MRPGARERVVIAAFALGGLLLALCFPPFEQADAVWMALAPVWIASACAGRLPVGRLAWATGIIAWSISLFWLTRVTVFGWSLMALYCAVYLVPTALFTAAWFRRFGAERFLPNAGWMLGVTAWWVAGEYVRSTLLTGFAWNPLGLVLHANRAFIQHASWGGVFAVGAIPVWINAGLAVTALRYLKGQARIGRRPHPELMLGMAGVLVAFVTGSNLARAPLPPGTPLRVALIQPAIPQEEKWSEDSVALIYERLRTLTAQAVLFTRPDLVVWPETALPDDVKFSAPSYELVDALSRLGAPLLVGSMDAEYLEGRRPRFYNVSFLFDTNGMISAEYRKQHLVLLGEYIPFHDTIPFLRAMTPNMESFTAGTTATVMRVAAAGGEAAFSPLICFEDTFAYLGRRAVRAGARLLINQTNDAWFDPSAASRQHQLHSIFRAVEHRVPVVRAANTGYTCAIDARGLVHDVLRGADGRHDQPGFQLVTVEVPPAGHPPTPYTRHGDLFAWACLLTAALFTLPLLRRRAG